MEGKERGREGREGEGGEREGEGGREGREGVGEESKMVSYKKRGDSGRKQTLANLPSSCIEGLPSTADSDGPLPHPWKGGYTGNVCHEQ